VAARRGKLGVQTGAGTIITEIGPKLTFRSQKAFFWNGQPVAWPLTILPEADSALLAVLELPLEEYLIGVLAKEMGNAGEAELEALKAQAVAARGFAYLKIGKRPELGYDLESDVSHQAFDPSAPVSPAVRKAVEKTRGLVLTCGGKLYAPNYHSTCGGRTALPSEAWGTADSLFPWARSVKCEHCRISPRFRWNVVLASGELARRALGLADTTIPITDVRIEARSPSGRVQRLRISSQAGDTVLFRDRIRFQSADNALSSTWFDVSCRRDDLGNVASVELNGRGFGHGVGMCQWGAMGMAREGKKYKKILKKFYHNSVICKVY
jgi:stage II sporulation protein D